MLAAVVLSGCGKKGPPLAPNSRVPAAVQAITAKRIGNDVYLSFVIPAENDDTTRPGGTRRVEIYGYTGFTVPPRGRFLDGATLVATVPVAPAPMPEEPLPAVGVIQVTDAGAAHGSLVRIVDHLDADELVDHPLPPLPSLRPPARVRPPTVVTPPPAPVTAPVIPVLRRFYMAIAWSDRNYPSAASALAELALTTLPEPPVVTYAEVQPPLAVAEVLVLWEPSGGLLGFLLDLQLPVEPAPFDDLLPRPVVAIATPAVPTGPTLYSVYRTIEPDPLALPQAVTASPLAIAPPLALTAVPLAGLAFRDPVELDERERCYTVRAVRGIAPAQIESEASAPPACVRPIDVYGPAAPRGLTAIPGERTITLDWVANEELDLGGYVVLRGEAGGATLLPLFDAPIGETRYTDRTVTPGVRYVYAVQAVDSRVPVPNVSVQSDTAEELAR